MKFQSFIMRVLCLILIIAAILGYNSVQKKDSDTEKEQEIASLTKRVENLEKQQEEMLAALEDAAKTQEEAKKKEEAKAAEDKNKDSQSGEDSAKDQTSKENDDKENSDSKVDQNSDDSDKDSSDNDGSKSNALDSEDSSDEEDLYYKNGTYNGEGQGFGGTITVAVTLEDDTIIDIQVVSAPGEDSAYLSQGEGVISTILSAQSTDVDTVSGATFSSTGIINAVNDALGKAENQ